MHCDLGLFYFLNGGGKMLRNTLSRILSVFLNVGLTCVVLFVTWPLIWLIWTCANRGYSKTSAGRKSLWQLTGMLVVSLIVLNLGYGFEGTCTKLGDYTFASRALAGRDALADGGLGGNLFSESCLRDVPIPLPNNYVRGIDLQKVDFE